MFPFFVIDKSLLAKWINDLQICSDAPAWFEKEYQVCKWIVHSDYCWRDPISANQLQQNKRKKKKKRGGGLGERNTFNRIICTFRYRNPDGGESMEEMWL